MRFMSRVNPTLDPKVCRQARLARDARFDGCFFVAVKTTGIYCRCICPAIPPKEGNVIYFEHAVTASDAGFRPCLRCRPDSAPHSAAWIGSHAVLKRSLRLIDGGYLQTHTLAELAEHISISDRYLRQLFIKQLGVSPKQYALHQQCLLAKQLLHQSQLPIKDVAIASGFNSVRRFNDCFSKTIKLTPSQIRKTEGTDSQGLQLKLHYRPPYDWPRMQAFLANRIIDGLEWSDKNHYGRTFIINGSHGQFTATHDSEQHAFVVDLQLEDLSQLQTVVHNVRRLLDLDVDILTISDVLRTHYNKELNIYDGLRLPGIWSLFEAGIRAILGQQVSVKAARSLVTQVVQNLGCSIGNQWFFPTPEALTMSDLSFIKIPNSRKQTLHNLANHFVNRPQEACDPNTWLALKGIGLWTVDYAKMRGLSEPDIYLGGDLGIQKAMTNKILNPQAAKPWRSYLTFQLWNQ